MKLARLSSRVFVFAFVALLSHDSWGQDDLPSAESVIRDHIDAIGSEMNLRTFESCEIRARVESDAPAFNGKMTLRALEGSFHYMFELEGQVSNWRIYDGKRFWEQSDGYAPILYDAHDAQAFIEIVPRVSSPLDWLDYHGTVEVVDKVDVRGSTCFQLKFTPKTGNPVFRFFDTSTLMLRRIRYTSPMTTDQRQADWYLSDYREFSGVTLPVKREQFWNGQHNYDVIIESVNLEAEVDKNLFEMPDEIKAQIAVRKTDGRKQDK